VNVGKLLIGHTTDSFRALPPGFSACSPNTRAHRRRRVRGDRTQHDRRKPMAALMIQSGPLADATVTVCHSRTRDLAAHTRRADILIAAAGRARLVTADMVKPGAVVIGRRHEPDSGSDDEVGDAPRR
jgi:methylenetetrahydrofolate dehydrogenase (NADP+)/methenyltetrahydrofolate cyclohydrolase